MKEKVTYILIAALVVVVVAIPAYMYATDVLSGDTITKADYCGANGYLEVYPCTDGSFQAIHENYSDGFRIVKPDGSTLDCPFTLPQYQEGECIDYTTAGTCGYMGNICESEDSCVSDVDCAAGSRCTDWQCA